MAPAGAMTGSSRDACGREGLAETGTDAREPAAILARPELRWVIDTRQPAGTVTGMMMHYFPLGEARRVCAELSGACLLSVPVSGGRAGAGRPTTPRPLRAPRPRTPPPRPPHHTP